jgi:hypothetical protein
MRIAFGEAHAVCSCSHVTRARRRLLKELVLSSSNYGPHCVLLVVSSAIVIRYPVMMKISLFLLGLLAGVVTPCPGHIPSHERQLDTRNVAVKPENRAIISARAVSPALLASTTVKSTVLVIARNDGEAQSVTSGLNGYGIPFQTLIVPQAGVPLPTLNTTSGGNFGAIVALSGLAYNCTLNFWPQY